MAMIISNSETLETISPKEIEPVPWLLLIMSLPSSQASRRVEMWRKLKKYGALPLPTSGYVLPNSPETLERFEWLAAAIRKYKGQASVVQARSFDDLSDDQLRELFINARSADYKALARELKKAGSNSNRAAVRPRLRRRFQEVVAIDFFHSPLRSRVEALLMQADSVVEQKSRTVAARSGKEYVGRIWITRPRPGIDRVSSAWLICRFVDSGATFVFGDDPRGHPDAVPFDMFQAGGFGHQGENCTFETLVAEFAIRNPKVKAIAQIIHDADLGDEKFGRVEGTGLDRVLIGWAQQGVANEEILRRGMELIEGLYRGIGQ
jgi:hypothetical protein